LYPPRLSQAVSTGLPLLWRLALAERLLFLRAGRDFPSSRYITGTFYIAIGMPFQSAFVFNRLRLEVTGNCFDSSKLPEVTFNKQ